MPGINTGCTTYAAVVGLWSVDKLTLLVGCVSLSGQLTAECCRVDRRYITAEHRQTPVHRPAAHSQTVTHN